MSIATTPIGFLPSSVGAARLGPIATTGSPEPRWKGLRKICQGCSDGTASGRGEKQNSGHPSTLPCQAADTSAQPFLLAAIRCRILGGMVTGLLRWAQESSVQPRRAPVSGITRCRNPESGREATHLRDTPPAFSGAGYGSFFRTYLRKRSEFAPFL